jgi:hypothetical protein
MTDPEGMGNALNDLELLHLAVQHGALSESQLEECLRLREDRKAADRPLYEIAIEKGFTTAQRLQDLARKGGGTKDPTLVMIEVVMACPRCGADQRLTLDAAIRGPRCPRCSGVLALRRSGSPSVKVIEGPVPEEVRDAARDAKSRFSKYILTAKLGVGGMGEVWKAWDTVLQRWVALKFPRSMEEEEIRRLYLEAQGAGRLAHPNITSVYEIAEAEGRHYIAMQYIPGITVEAALERPGGAPLREIVRWVRDAAMAAHFAHENGVVHRDFKPANLMIDPKGQVYVMDFGLAKVRSATSATVSGMILGTPSFMPPEQASGRAQEIDRRSDVYSLGATLYVMLSGRKPFDGETVTDVLVKILTLDPPRLREVRPEIPWELEAVVEKAMRRSKDERYPTAQELADDLTRFLSDEPIRARRSTVTYRVARNLRRHRGYLFTVGACLAVLAAGALFLPGRSAPEGPDRLRLWSSLYGELAPALSFERFDPGRARTLLERAGREFPEQKAAIESLLEGEQKGVSRFLETLPEDRWLESRDRVRRCRDWLAFVRQPTDTADRILAYRGRFTLTVHVAPYAEVRGGFVRHLPEGERFTPLTLRDVEIADEPIELAHPDFGVYSFRIPDPRPGRSYVVEGEWKNPQSISVREGP